MSSTLYWRPADAGRRALPDGLKAVLKDMQSLDDSSVSFLLGARAVFAATRGADNDCCKAIDLLLRAIGEYTEIELNEVY